MKVVVLCSGLGTRLKPLTDYVHKSLLPTIGNDGSVEPLLVRNIISLCSDQDLNISEVIITVRGGMTKDFCHDFEECYNLIRIRSKCNVKVSEINCPEDPETYNNSYTFLHALKYLIKNKCNESVLVLEGDILIGSGFSSVLSSYESSLDKRSISFCRYRSGKEWTLIRKPNDTYEIVKDSSGLALTGISLIKNGFQNFLSYIKSNIKPGDFWDEHFIDYFSKTRSLRVVNYEDVSEFDSLEDLFNSKNFNPSLIKYIIDENSKSSKNDTCQLDSMTNTNFTVIDKKDGIKKVVRIPGKGTDTFINRDREAIFNGIASGLGVAPSSVIYRNGIKITEWINCTVLSPYRSKDLIEVLSKLHMSGTPAEICECTLVNLIEELKLYESLYPDSEDPSIPSDYLRISQFYKEFIRKYQYDNLVFCHRDMDPRNILYNEKEKKVFLVDFEYSGYLNFYWDLGCYLSEVRLDFILNKKDKSGFIKWYSGYFVEAIKYYESITGYNVDLNTINLWSGVVDFIWSAWSIAKINLGEDFKEYFNERWSQACKVVEDAKRVPKSTGQ